MGAEDFDKMQAYKIANGQVNANPLVGKDGVINLAMDYESEQESEGTVQILDFKGSVLGSKNDGAISFRRTLI